MILMLRNGSVWLLLGATLAGCQSSATMGRPGVPAFDAAAVPEAAGLQDPDEQTSSEDAGVAAEVVSLDEVDPATEPTGEEHWEFGFLPLVWMAGMEGSVTADGVKTKVDASFMDVVDVLNWGAAGLILARRGPWEFHFEGMYLATEDVVRLPTGDKLRIEGDAGIFELLTHYRFYEHSLCHHDEDDPGPGKDETGHHPSLTFDARAGIRYWYQENVLDLRGTGLRQSDVEGWWDPLVGMRIQFDPWQKFKLHLGGDVGVGFEANRTWRFEAGAGYALTERLRLLGGYRVLSVDYTDGTGADRFAFNVKMEGPFVGCLVLF